MMNRVKTLAENLLTQITNEAPAVDLLNTVQMLAAEIVNASTPEANDLPKGLVAVFIQKTFTTTAAATDLVSATENEVIEEKSVEILQVDEAEILAELEEIKRNINDRAALGTHSKPDYHFDPVEEIPTLAQQHTPIAKSVAEPVPVQHQAYMPATEKTKVPAKEIHAAVVKDASPSLNDVLKPSGTELSDSLKDAPLKDLKKGIGINDRFLYINELFRGDETMYERSIKTINAFAIYPEAEYWIKRELKLKLAWDDKNAVVAAFDQLVRRRFS